LKLIIFDIDGTLCHSRFIDDKCYIQAFKKGLGINIENTNWNSYKHVTDYHITKKILETETGKAPDNEVVELIIDLYADELKIQLEKDDTSFVEIPGAVNLIDYLKRNITQYHIGIATGGFLKTALHKLDKIGIQMPDDFIYSSNNSESKQEMIIGLMNREKELKFEFEKIIYVGDREYDYTVSKELNIDFIGVDFRKNGKLRSLGIKKVINNYEPIEKFLEKI